MLMLIYYKLEIYYYSFLHNRDQELAKVVIKKEEVELIVS